MTQTKSADDRDNAIRESLAHPPETLATSQNGLAIGTESEKRVATTSTLEGKKTSPPREGGNFSPPASAHQIAIEKPNVLESPPASKDSESIIRPAKKSISILEANALKKQYFLGKHTVNALIGVDFVVYNGEFVALMGPSGSGKSTLLHMIGGLDKPSDGEVTLAGRKLSILKDDEVTLVRRHNIGFVFQFYNLIPTLTAEENIALPLIIDGQDPRKYQKQIEGLLKLVGLEDRYRHKPDQLSGGEQQRVSIARALVTKPAVVLADEPTGNLDSKTGATIMRLLRQSCDDLGQTIIVVTHDPKAASYADRIVFLSDGKIVNQIQFGDLNDPAQRLRLVIETMEKIQV